MTRACARDAARRVLAVGLAFYAAVAVGAPSVLGQQPAPSVSVSFGVDTTAADVGEIVRLVRAYLARPDTTAASRGLWSTVDSLDRRAGDLHRYFTYQGFAATVVGVISAGPADSLYAVKVLYARADSTGRQVMPLALQRLYAVRAPDAPYGWMLSNALPRLTRGWPARREGRITFHYAPGMKPDPARAARAARFVDSVATVFDVPPPERIDLYVASSPDEYFDALGLDFFPLPSGPGTATGGHSLPAAGIVLSGDPAQAEAYLHEIVHVILGGRMGGGVILGEGLPVWLSGSKGRPARAMYRLLADYQKEHPDVTLDSLIRGAAGEGRQVDDARYATGALFVDAVHRRDGVAGLRALMGTPSDPAGLLASMRRHLGLAETDPGALEGWWREATREAAEGR